MTVVGLLKARADLKRIEIKCQRQQKPQKRKCSMKRKPEQ